MGGKFSEGKEMLEPVGDARYGSVVLWPWLCGGYAYADIEGDG